MHGLIFKTKESHRQDQSESFVIYICTYKNTCMCVFHNKSNEITSLWPVFIDINMTFIFVVSSRRNKTNPHHRNKFIPVFDATHLQACKPKLSTYDQLLKTDQQDVSLYMCVRKLKHFQPHSLLCQLWCTLICSLFVVIWDLYMIVRKVDEAASTNFFFHHTQCISYCYTTVSTQSY